MASLCDFIINSIKLNLCVANVKTFPHETRAGIQQSTLTGKSIDLILLFYVYFFIDVTRQSSTRIQLQRIDNMMEVCHVSFERGYLPMNDVKQ